MRTPILTIAIVLFASATLFAQKNIPCSIIFKEGETIMAHHFGQKDCNGNVYYTGYIMLKGKYMSQVTEIKEYTGIKRLDLIDFDKDPASSVGNQKGKIVVHKKNGISVTLEEAELILSCMGSDEMYNQIKVQVVNPLTDKIFEQAVDVKHIKSIVFN
jgi:hypothetical protein